MSHYKSNLRDTEFNLFELFGRGDVLGTGIFEDLDVDTAKSILAEIDRLSREDLAVSFDDGDRNPPVYDPAAKTVTMNPAFAKSYNAWMEAEWWRLGLPEALGGQAAPASLIWSSGEFVLGANPAVWIYACGP
ncbi:MAG: acyl-CoA dehydrogenase, partial [Kineosporiaceae bacterium]|nr:acyl-CoA dehydrogenase [Aeromicrobium sp.]